MCRRRLTGRMSDPPVLMFGSEQPDVWNVCTFILGWSEEETAPPAGNVRELIRYRNTYFVFRNQSGRRWVGVALGELGPEFCLLGHSLMMFALMVVSDWLKSLL
ncbi:hypothetical protein CHARACLAT_008270 [Characodon lateralis]|uniref:Uncharacterized protein n=1 Tax=Characodon lateralis TaxID=208331 RepID=A0ABU7DSJ1_9TELE|nr:hypothetical protein [Characodon lateralis]